MIRRSPPLRSLARLAILVLLASAAPTTASAPPPPITDPTPDAFQCSVLQSLYEHSWADCQAAGNPLFRADCALACDHYHRWLAQCPIGNQTLNPFVCDPPPTRLWETD